MIRALKSIVPIIICMLTVSTLFGCNANDDRENEDNTLTMYIVSENPIISLINEYNKSDVSSDIKLVEFEDNDKLDSKLDAEIMAGKGPDLIFYDSGYNGVSNIEKMMSLDMFADYNELIDNDKTESKINFDDCNKTVMDSGVYDGKRYFIPISYMPDITITTKEICDKYSVDLNQSFTYKTADNMLSDFLNEGNKSQDKSVFYWINNEIYALIDSNIDFFARTNTLKSEEFLSNLDVIDKLILPNDRKEISNNVDPLDSIIQGNVMFASLYQIAGSEPNSIAYVYYYLSSNNQTPVILNSLSNKENSFSAFIDKGLLINKNSNKKEEAYEFVKYMLNEKTQSNTEIGLPVNKNAQKQLIEKMEEGLYGSESINDNAKSGISDDFVNSYIDFLDNINSCGFKNNYYDSVISDMVSQYVSGDITKEKFIDQIKNKTEIYLEE